MRASWSVQSMVRSRPRRSAMIISPPIGVGRRSISSCSRSRGIGGKPQMLLGIGVPRPPGGRRLAVEVGSGDLTVPVAGSAHARPPGDQRCELGIAREMAIDGDDIGAEIEHALYARYDGGQGAHLWKADSDGN